MNKKNKQFLLFTLLLLILFSACSKQNDTEIQQNDANIFVEAESPTPTLTPIEAAPDISEKASEQDSGFDDTASPEPTDFIADTNNNSSELTSEIQEEPAQNQIISGTLTIAFLDVGQADSIYITLPNGGNMLIDAGNSADSNRIISYIRDNNNSNTIDYVIATHPHADHIGGMGAVINTFEIKSVWMPDAIHTTRTFENLLDVIEANNLMIDTAKAGRILFDYGNLKAEFIAPIRSGYSNLNNYSAVILLTYNDHRFLFMGDAERESEEEILAGGLDISADVIKIGHHGSRTSSIRPFIQRVNPRYAVISCGSGNSYGHPSGETLAILADFEIKVLRTDESGTIVIKSDGIDITFDTFRTEIQPRAPNPTVAPTVPTQVEAEEPAANTQTQIEVYVTRTGTRYHLDGCRHLSQSKIPISLEEARKTYGPCSVCRPPE
jgi:competence protein ComEC